MLNWVYFLIKMVETVQLLLVLYSCYCIPTCSYGHIVFGSDPISVTFLCAGYLMNKWMDLNQVSTDITIGLMET